MSRLRGPAAFGARRRHPHGVIVGLARWAAFLALLIALPKCDVHAASMDDALISAYLHNPRLEAGRAVLRATDELVPQALAAGRPRLFLDAAVDGVAQDTDASARDERVTGAVGVSLRQPLYAGGGIRADIRQAESDVRAERALLVATEQQVLLDAVGAYTATWRDRAVLELAVVNDVRTRRQLQATRDRFEVGEVARTDVAQAEARLARAQADIATARADLAASAAAYRDIVGLTPGLLAEPQPLLDLPSSEDEAQAQAGGNPDITRAMQLLQSAREAVDVAAAALLPSLDLAGSLSYRENESNVIGNRSEALIGLRLSVPLYQGGADRSRVRQARQTVDARDSDLEDTVRGIRRSVTTSWERLLAAGAAADAFAEEARANQIALDGVQEEALVGQRSVLDVLDAEQELFTAQVSLVRARREQVAATYQLKSAVGGLTVAGLGLAVQPYAIEASGRHQRDRVPGID